MQPQARVDAECSFSSVATSGTIDPANGRRRISLIQFGLIGSGADSRSRGLFNARSRGRIGCRTAAIGAPAGLGWEMERNLFAKNVLLAAVEPSLRVPTAARLKSVSLARGDIL